MMKNIILVEDNKIERRNIGHTIESMKECSLVGVFFNGVEALEFLHENDVDIVITDVQMPLMDGIELSKKIRKYGMEVEIIIISGYQDFDNAKSAIGLDVVDYVMKPVINNELEHAINKAIERISEKQIKNSDYKQLQEQIEISKDLLLEQFMRRLIISPDTDAEFIKKHESFFNINLTDGYKAVLIAKINKENNKHMLMTLHSMSVNIGKHINEKVSCYAFVISESEICIVVVGNDHLQMIAQSIVLKNKLAALHNADVFMAMSSIRTNIRHIGQMYEESEDILKKMSDKWNVVVWYPGDKTEDADEFVLALQQLQEYIIANDMPSVDEMIDFELSKCETVEKKHNFICAFVNLLEVVLAVAGLDFDDSETLTSNEVWGKVADFESIVDLTDFCRKLVKIVMEKLDESNNEKIKVVNRVKKIIRERYSEHITVEAIAKEVSFSRKHVHRIFVQEVGMSIFEYLTEYRIEVAKKLIMEDETIDDIVFKIGYKDIKYFYGIFKEKTGMTPKQFKEVQRQESKGDKS